MTTGHGCRAVISSGVPADLPPIPGRSRASYGDGGKQSRRARRHHRFTAGPPGGRARQTYRAHGRGGSKRRWPRRVLAGIVVLVVLVVVVGAGGYLYLRSRLDGIPRVAVPALTPQHAGQPVDILLVGSDSRSCVKTSSQAKAFGTSATTSGQRSDVIVVMRFVTSIPEVEMLSIPRDTWVPIAGTGGSAKVNAAFASGPNQLVQTIQEDFHIPINHVMMVNFCGFQGMVNALGGIWLDFRYPLRDQYSGLDIATTGCQLINGAQALALVRSRHLYYYANRTWNYDGMSDWSRIRRQQAFFHGLLNRVHSAFPDVLELNSFLGAAVSDLTVDSSFSSSEMISLGYRYRSLGESGLTTTVLPTYSKLIDGQDALLPAEPEASRAIGSFLAAGASPGQGASAGAGSGSGAGSGATSTATTPTTSSPVPPSGVVTDTPQSLPEPWNPVTC